jgi:molybdopterin-guanine dinucleotide biosynthesis protein A
MADGCTLVILAGGASRRMGRDKALLPAGERSMAERLLRRLGPAVDDAIIAGGSAAPVGARHVADRLAGRGPLAGMQVAFDAAGHPWVWVVACDLPDVEPAVLALLQSHSDGVDAVVPVVAGEVQGLCALYRRDVGTKIGQLLESNQSSVKALLQAITTRYLDEPAVRRVDPELRSFRNINTPADYEAWLKSR